MDTNLDTKLARWKADGGDTLTAYTLRTMYGLVKADLRTLIAAGTVTEESRLETTETWGMFGRGNLKRTTKCRTYYRVKAA